MNLYVRLEEGPPLYLVLHHPVCTSLLVQAQRNSITTLLCLNTTLAPSSRSIYPLSWRPLLATVRTGHLAEQWSLWDNAESFLRVTVVDSKRCNLASKQITQLCFGAQINDRFVASNRWPVPPHLAHQLFNVSPLFNLNPSPAQAHKLPSISTARLLNSTRPTFDASSAEERNQFPRKIIGMGSVAPRSARNYNITRGCMRNDRGSRPRVPFIIESQTWRLIFKGPAVDRWSCNNTCDPTDVGPCRVL